MIFEHIDEELFVEARENASSTEQKNKKRYNTLDCTADIERSLQKDENIKIIETVYPKGLKASERDERNYCFTVCKYNDEPILYLVFQAVKVIGPVTLPNEPLGIELSEMLSIFKDSDWENIVTDCLDIKLIIPFAARCFKNAIGRNREHFRLFTASYKRENKRENTKKLIKDIMIYDSLSKYCYNVDSNFDMRIQIGAAFRKAEFELIFPMKDKYLGDQSILDSTCGNWVARYALMFIRLGDVYSFFKDYRSYNIINMQNDLQKKVNYIYKKHKGKNNSNILKCLDDISSAIYMYRKHRRIPLPVCYTTIIKFMKLWYGENKSNYYKTLCAFVSSNSSEFYKMRFALYKIFREDPSIAFIIAVFSGDKVNINEATVIYRQGYYDTLGRRKLFFGKLRKPTKPYVDTELQAIFNAGITHTSENSYKISEEQKKLMQGKSQMVQGIFSKRK